MALQSNTHRQKRPFQPSITSFFPRIDDRDSYSIPQLPSHTPVLEPSVQSDLLSVGMRIRKAVPEGYKTHKTSLFYDPTPAISSSVIIPSKPLELLPFCGLHKVGGFSVQNSAPVDSHEPFDIFTDDRMPFSLSQESNTSTISTESMPTAPILNPLNANKRRFTDEDGNEDVSPFELQFSDPLDPLLAELRVTSPRNGYPISHTTMPDLSAVSHRAIARPRTRKKGVMRAAEDVENDIDFEEAPFLEPWEDGEIEMGGM